MWVTETLPKCPQHRSTECWWDRGTGTAGGWDGEIRTESPAGLAAKGWHCKVAWRQSVMESGFVFQVLKNLIWRCLLLSDKCKWYENKESPGEEMDALSFCALLELDPCWREAVFTKDVSIRSIPWWRGYLCGAATELRGQCCSGLAVSYLWNTNCIINILDRSKLGVCTIITVNSETVQRWDVFMFDCICPLKIIFL